jgi:phospholipid-translocating ATPase
MMFEDLMLTLYNLVFTSLPIGFLGAWDQDIDGKTTLRYPELYRMGLRNDIFKAWQFWLAVVDALYQSIVCFFIPYLLLIAGATDPNGHDFNGVHDNGVAVAGIVVFAANFYVAFSMYNFTWIQVFIIALSILVYFLYIGVYSESNDFYYAGQIRLFGTGMYWLVLLLTMVAAFIPRVIITFYQHQYHPYDNDVVREIELVLRSKRRSDSGVDKTDFQDGIELEAR